MSLWHSFISADEQSGVIGLYLPEWWHKLLQSTHLFCYLYFGLLQLIPTSERYLPRTLLLESPQTNMSLLTDLLRWNHGAVGLRLLEVCLWTVFGSFLLPFSCPTDLAIACYLQRGTRVLPWRSNVRSMGSTWRTEELVGGWNSPLSFGTCFRHTNPSRLQKASCLSIQEKRFGPTDFSCSTMAHRTRRGRSASERTAWLFLSYCGRKMGDSLYCFLLRAWHAKHRRPSGEPPEDDDRWKQRMSMVRCTDVAVDWEERWTSWWLNLTGYLAVHRSYLDASPSSSARMDSIPNWNSALQESSLRLHGGCCEPPHSFRRFWNIQTYFFSSRRRWIRSTDS